MAVGGLEYKSVIGALLFFPEVNVRKWVWWRRLLVGELDGAVEGIEERREPCMCRYGCAMF